jgi:hypothetical protein
MGDRQAGLSACIEAFEHAKEPYSGVAGSQREPGRSGYVESRIFCRGGAFQRIYSFRVDCRSALCNTAYGVRYERHECMWQVQFA